MDEIVKQAKEQGLSNDEAQKILDRDNNLANSIVDAQWEQVEKNKEVWLDELKADPEIGGDHIKETAEISRRVLEAYFPAEVKQLLVDSGYGNKLSVAQGFVKIGRALNILDDKVVEGSKPTKQEKSMEEIFYGTAN